MRIFRLISMQVVPSVTTIIFLYNTLSSFFQEAFIYLYNTFLSHGKRCWTISFDAEDCMDFFISVHLSFKRYPSFRWCTFYFRFKFGGIQKVVRKANCKQFGTDDNGIHQMIQEMEEAFSPSMRKTSLLLHVFSCPNGGIVPFLESSLSGYHFSFSIGTTITEKYSEGGWSKDSEETIKKEWAADLNF